MMLLGDVRAEVASVCGRMAASGLVVGTSGNVSARSGDLVAVSPSGLDYADLTAELVGVHRLDGSAVAAPLAPTSEMPLHLAVYTATGAGAIVHTHSPAATAASVLLDEVPAVHYQVAAFGGPVAVAPYATFGTGGLAANVVAALHGRTACLMANHGAVAIGPDWAPPTAARSTWNGCATCTCGRPRPAPRGCCPPRRSTWWRGSSPATASGHQDGSRENRDGRR